MRKRLLACIGAMLFIMTGCVSRVDPGDVFIDEIAMGETVCVAKVMIKDGISYEVSVSAPSGESIMTTLGMQDDYTTWSGPLWYSQRGMNENPYSYPLPFSTMPEGYYYLYVGGMGSALTNVKISVTGSGEGAEIEFLTGK